MQEKVSSFTEASILGITRSIEEKAENSTGVLLDYSQRNKRYDQYLLIRIG
jgi:hypothetical protein